ncbi:MAG: V-type ATPase 116kDa subunit family protein [Candidatus Micrarchaeia archaeon]
MVLKLAQMSKLRVISTQDNASRIVETLYKFGAIQVEQSTMAELDRPTAKFGQISDNLVHLRAVEKRLDIKDSGKAEAPLTLADAMREAKKIDFPKLNAIDSELDSVKSSLEQSKAAKAALEPFKNLEVSPAIFAKTDGSVKFSCLALKATNAKQAEEVAGKIRKELDASGHHEMLSFSSAGRHYAIIAQAATAAAAGDALPAAASKYGATTVPIPRVAGNSFSTAYISASGDFRRLDAKKAALERDAERFKAANQAQIAKVRRSLEVEALKATLPAKFGRTEKLNIAEGWVEGKAVKTLEAALEKATSGAVVVEKIETSEAPPSILDNPAAVRPFEFLIRFFSLPHSDEIDPTLFISITFPLFFGMILGDIAYGLIALAIALALRKSSSGFLRDIAGMMLLSGISTTIFGIVYGEFLGIEIETREIFAEFLQATGAAALIGMHAETLAELLPHVPRMEEEGLAIVIAACIGLGALQLLLGFILGVVNNFSQGHKSHAYGKICWAALEISLLAAGISLGMPAMFGEISGTIGNAAAGVAVLCVLGIIKFEGGAAAIEVFGLLSNLLSYLRIMALGISGAILAQLISGVLGSLNFNLVGKMFSGEAPFDVLQVIFLILGLLFFIAGHAFSLALGIFESSIQSLRLHYVEFFSKFYKGGGRAFVPLRRTDEE